MSSYIINIKKSSGSWATKADVTTIVPDVGFNYTDKLNEVNEAIINLSGTGEVKRAIIDIGAEIKIYKDGTLDFHGLINVIDYLEAGGISIRVKGYEWWLGLENGAYAGSPWTSTASATIFSAIIAESNYFTAGTVEAGSSVDYRAGLTDSLWNVISNLKQATSQDIGIDYANAEVDILDHKGSATSVKTFNSGIQIGDVRITHNYPLGNKVLVYGKSEGQTRITSSYPTYGRDASSQSTYGIITKIIRDPKITTAAQANILADAEVARLKDPIKIYAFEVLNPTQTLVSGDVITLNARSQGVENEDVRIVGIERGNRGDQEYLTLQVTNAAYSQLIKSANQVIAGINKTFRDQQTYDEYEEEYSNQVNTTTSIGGVIDIYPSYLDMGGYELFDTPGIVNLTEDVYFQSNYNGLYVEFANGHVSIFNSDWIDCDFGKLINVVDPTANQDAATKKYVDDNIAILPGEYHWGCVGASFKGLNPDTDQLIIDNLTARIEAQSDQIILVAPIHLPHGAVVTSAIVYGNTSVTEIWYLKRVAWTGAQVTMASANIGSGDGSISNATILNSTYAYFLVTTSIDNGDAIHGATIAYNL